MKKPRLTLIGVGHPFLRDDRAGPLTIQRLKKKLSTTQDDLLLIDAAGSPENFLGPILRFEPDHLFLIDAVDMGKEPGSILTLDWKPEMHLDTQPFSLPLDKFCLFVHMECRCPISIIGIQAQTIGYGTEVSEPVSKTIAKLAKQLSSEWQQLHIAQ